MSEKERMNGRMDVVAKIIEVSLQYTFIHMNWRKFKNIVFLWECILICCTLVFLVHIIRLKSMLDRMSVGPREPQASDKNTSPGGFSIMVLPSRHFRHSYFTFLSSVHFTGAHAAQFPIKSITSTILDEPTTTNILQWCIVTRNICMQTEKHSHSIQTEKKTYKKPLVITTQCVML